MAIHPVIYDDDGCAENEPWDLDDHLVADGFGEVQRALVTESVLSWLSSFHEADVPMTEALADLRAALADFPSHNHAVLGREHP